ncbi:hypothetical protein ACIZ62_13595 [Acetobacterium carbinolicum]
MVNVQAMLQKLKEKSRKEGISYTVYAPVGLPGGVLEAIGKFKISRKSNS